MKGVEDPWGIWMFFFLGGKNQKVFFFDWLLRVFFFFLTVDFVLIFSWLLACCVFSCFLKCMLLFWLVLCKEILNKTTMWVL